MTLIEAIAQARAVKPNQYDDATLVRWISELDGKIYEEYIKGSIVPEAPEPAPEPVVPEEPDTGADIPAVEPEPEPEPEKPFPWPYDVEADMQTVLLVPEPYSDVYIKYISVQVDYYNGESERYANSMIMFNMAQDAFSAWHNRNNMHRQDYYVRI